ncbi:MAG: methionine gamma-lyase family protein [Clostridia bacterium]|nr:methionine gamma-lyase family protein [Clostridia bacterium]
MIIKDEIKNLAYEAESSIRPYFDRIDEIAMFNQEKVLDAFIKHGVSEALFNPTTGYGYDDKGREVLDEIYADIFRAEDALVRHNIVNGTHCLAISLFSVLRPGDTLLAATGKPYDTLEEVIGISGSNNGSLKEFGVNYKQVDLINGKVDFEGLKKAITPDVKAVILQRSKGYDWRTTLSCEELGEAISFIKSTKEDAVCIVDNCYGEFTQTTEPTEFGADMVVGSLIKNVGGSLAQSGGYIAGKKKYIELAAYRQTAPGIGKECGATLGQNRFMYQGLFMAPHIVAQALKSAIFCGELLIRMGYEVTPVSSEPRYDIIQAIKFNDSDKLIKFIQGIQKASPVDSYVSPMPWDMPGYQHQVIMAAGTFVSGASIELSADAPIKPPYVAFMQGGITYESARLAIMYAAGEIL